MLFSPAPSSSLKLGPPLVIEIGVLNPVHHVRLGLMREATPKGLEALARGQKKFRGTIELTELNEENLVLDVPTGFCSRGEAIWVELRARREGDPDTWVLVEGKVAKQSFDPGTKDRETIQVDLVHPQGASPWSEVRARLLDRQSAVDRTLEGVRG